MFIKILGTIVYAVVIITWLNAIKGVIEGTMVLGKFNIDYLYELCKK